MRDVELSPDPNLMESMRAVGYTTSTAIADIVDNSVSALAGRVDVFFAAAPEPYVAILDDGEGMDRAALIEAMRLAGRSPRTERGEHDLGRFGLGLKTASLSQCRCLTVVSTRDGDTNGVCWDLNHLTATGTWTLRVLEASDIAAVPGYPRLADQTAGTLVVWTDLDRIAEQADDIEEHLDERMARAREHLSLVFHRFIAQTTPPLDRPLTITFNGSPIPSVDPFLTRHRGIQEGPRETFRVRGAEISVKPYTLPYLNKLTAKDRATALISGTLRDTPGVLHLPRLPPGAVGHVVSLDAERRHEQARARPSRHSEQPGRPLVTRHQEVGRDSPGRGAAAAATSRRPDRAAQPARAALPRPAGRPRGPDPAAVAADRGARILPLRDQHPTSARRRARRPAATTGPGESFAN